MLELREINDKENSMMIILHNKQKIIFSKEFQEFLLNIFF